MWVTFLLFACSNSGLNTVDAGTTGSGDTGVTGDTAPTAVETCPWVGVWELTEVNCGSFPYDDWWDVYTTTVMSMTHSPDGGCAVSFTWSGEYCQESESWHLAEPTGTSVEATYNGIDDCSPADCTFAGSDDACALGDRTGSETITIDDSTGDLTVVGPLGHGAPSCVLDLITTWTAQ